MEDTYQFELEDPKSYRDRFELIMQAPIASSNIEDSDQDKSSPQLVRRIAQGLGRDQYDKGMQWVSRSKRLAYQHFSSAAHSAYTPGAYEAFRMLISATADEMCFTEIELRNRINFWQDFIEKIEWHEIESALLTGTRPVIWQLAPSEPSSENPRWGKGSFFFFEYEKNQYAITAKHVVDGIDPETFRLTLPEDQGILPVHEGFCLTPPSKDLMSDEYDIYAWKVDYTSITQHLEWHAWNLGLHRRSANEAAPRQKVYIAGYPYFEDNIDDINFTINENPMIITGELQSEKIVDSLYTIHTSSEFHNLDYDGFSGSPVFARFNQLFKLIGLCVRGNGKNGILHFISSEHIVNLISSKYPEA